jgi:hypothetical protein
MIHSGLGLQRAKLEIYVSRIAVIPAGNAGNQMPWMAISNLADHFYVHEPYADFHLRHHYLCGAL